eukprot:2563566-Pleurochrysis_carterae.AAC.1
MSATKKSEEKKEIEVAAAKASCECLQRRNNALRDTLKAETEARAKAEAEVKRLQGRRRYRFSSRCQRRSCIEGSC